jgi:GDP-L-fucose synthase
MIEEVQPDTLIHLAARVGGVKGNTDYVADFYSENIRMNTNVLDAANFLKVNKVVSLLSTCIYPDAVNYPLTPDQIHDGPPHPSNFGYAYAKRMLHVQSMAISQQYGGNFIVAVPGNIYGPCDNFDLECGHVIPAIIRKVWEAKNSSSIPEFWGSGKSLREFTYSEDVAGALLFLLENYESPDPINIGKTGESTIKDVVNLVCEELEYYDDVFWDLTKPEGQYRKPSDNSKFREIGWNTSSYTSLRDGIKLTCNWFKENYPTIRGVV